LEALPAGLTFRDSTSCVDSASPGTDRLMPLAELLLTLVVIWVSAQLFGELAERLNQPAVLGELVAGVVVGVGGLGLVDPDKTVVHLLAEIGALILLFEIGLETRLGDLLRVGPASVVVAVTGMLLPFAGGYLLATAFGREPIYAVFLGATFTATSVGVTARVFRDLGHLNTVEARVILGAAVIDDVLGLVILTQVTSLLAGDALSASTALGKLGIAVLFLGGSLGLGRFVVPRVMRGVSGLRVRGALVPAAMAMAFGLALLAVRAGSATIIGAFAAGLILAETDRRHEIEHGVRPVAHLFVPIFFVTVGAQVNLADFNPLDRATWPMIAEVLGLSALAVATKWAAGYSVFWMRLRRNVVGAGMVARGEVGLIFAQVGRSSGVLSSEQFGVVVLVVMVTTFVAPVVLRGLLGKPPSDGPGSERPRGVEEIVTGIE
jgi:Kef-type K+ transport system membrane component KefB